MLLVIDNAMLMSLLDNRPDCPSRYLYFDDKFRSAKSDKVDEMSSSVMLSYSCQS